MKNTLKIIWKYARAWLLVSVIVIAFFFTATMVATQNDFLAGTIDTVMGGEGRRNTKGDPNKYAYFTKTTEGFSQFQTDMKLSNGVISTSADKKTVLAEARKLNEEIVSEGIVLLKNKDGALPLESGAKISVFGKNSANIVLGGSGSGGGNSADSVSLYKGLENAGFKLNPELVKFYESNASGKGRDKNPAIGAKVTGLAVGETPQDSYTDAVKKSYDNYKDAAIIVFSRIGGEGFDLPRLQKTSYGGDPVNGAAADGHYLRLDENEEALIQSVVDSHKFERVIVLINCATSMELGFIEENDAIDAALWIGSPGSTGANAVGKVLSGAVTPSGHLVDTYVRDFTKDPTWQNFGDNLSDGGNTYLAAGSKLGSYYVEYEEGIYLGYRYYETRSQQDIYRFGEDGGWYNESVVYPFGYGLSYATFDWSIVGEGTTPIGTVLDKDANSTITVKVKVRNTSENYSGKDVVQVYFSAPYYRNQIEKAHVVLGGMAKTKLLAPGEEEICTVTLKVQDMASYDYNDANDNGFKGYELDMGKYTLYIGKNAHECWASDEPMLLEYSVGEGGLQYPYDSETNNDNHFDYMSEYMSGKTLSRSGFSGTFPQTPTLAEREISDTVRNALKFSYDDANADYMKTFTSARREQGKKGTAPQLYEMIGKDYDDPKWDEMIDYLTVEDMVLLVGQANFHTISLDKIGKPRTIDPDGPAGYTNFMGDPTVHDTCFYASECVIGATWNTALANDMGVMVGLESLVGYTKGDGRTYSGWYAPAVNIHRSPFSGRNWEYYSEDPFLSGSMGAQVVKGASSKGVYTFVKHFVLNDQETNRDSDGLITWADEQTFREIYLKPFRIIVEEGKTSAVMSSFNRIGTVWAGGSYALLTEVLRNEWGFKGMVISDYNLSNGYMHPDQMIRAGGDINLSQDYKPSFTATKSGMEEDVQLQALRLATKNVLYTVANSNAMNGMGEGVEWKTTMAKWKVMLIFVNIGLVLLAALWGFFAIKKAFKKAAAAEAPATDIEAEPAPETSEKEEE